MITPAIVMDDTVASPLSLAPDVGQAVQWLDAVSNDRRRYASLFAACVDAIGCKIGVCYHEGCRKMFSFVPLEELADRQGCITSLVEHADRHHMRQAVMNDVEHRGLVYDRGSRNPRVLARVVRDFLAIGGNIHITPAGVLDHSQGMAAGWGDGSGRSDWIENCTRSYLRMLAVPGAATHIERMVRKLGATLPSGFIVLEAKP